MRLLKSVPRASRLGAGAAALALAAGSAVALSTPAAAAPSESDTNSAYALAAEGTLVNIEPTPYLVFEGKPLQDRLATIPMNPLVDAKALNAHVNPALGQAKIVGAKLLQGALQAQVIRAQCTNGKVDAMLANLRLAGQKLTLPDGAPISTHPAPNTTIELPPAQLDQLKQLEQVADVTLTLNKQVELDGGGVKVTALQIEADLVGDLITQTVSLATATCGAPASGLSNGPDNGNAPEPTPVEGNLAVTG